MHLIPNRVSLVLDMLGKLVDNDFHMGRCILSPETTHGKEAHAKSTLALSPKNIWSIESHTIKRVTYQGLRLCCSCIENTASFPEDF